MKNYLDQIWFQKFKEIYSYKRSYFVNKNPEIEISEFDIKFIDGISSKSDLRKKRLLGFLERKKNRIENFREEILTQEKNEFIKNKYLRKLDFIAIENQINLIKLTEDETTKAKQIDKLFRNLWKVEEKELEVFINEFIDFVKFLEKKFPENKSLNEFSNPEFYNIEYKKTGIDFDKFYGNNLRKIQTFKQFEKIKFDSEQVKKVIRKFVKKTDLTGVSIRIENRLLFSVEPILKRVNIPRNLEISQKRLIEIIAHEICVHLLRSINGYKNTNDLGESIKILGTSDTENLNLEEGLATFFEQNIFGKSGKQDIFRLFNHYFSSIGVFLGRNFEPIDVYKKLVNLHKVVSPFVTGIEDLNDFETAKRIKRIYGDFENPEIRFLNPKIAIYLIGNRKVWEMIEQGKNIVELFSGKISYDDLNDLRKMNFEINNKFFGEKEINFEKIRELIMSCF